jgi:hypothetical protein
MRSRPNLHWIHEDADQIDEFAGAAIARGFKLKEFAVQTPDSDLLRIPFQLSPDIRVHQQIRAGEDGWVVEKGILRQAKGIHYSGTVDVHMLDLLGRCNGQRTLQELIRRLAERLGAAAAQISPSVLQIMRGLIERGFVLPAVMPSWTPNEIQSSIG